MIGTAPHISTGKTVASNIEMSRIYGDAMFRWLMENMEEAKDESERTCFLNRVESFNQNFFEEMKNHFEGLSTREELFSEEDREIYKEQAKLYDFLWSLIN